MNTKPQQRAWLLIDTCGETASVALGWEESVVALEELPRQRASSGIIGAIHRMLNATGCHLAGLEGVGVVSGPGSFTGVRTGLAAAKGLCEAASLPLVSVSRLAVLSRTAGTEGFVVLDAGRGEVYVRAAGEGSEWICPDGKFVELAAGTRVVVTEMALMERLDALKPTLCPLNAGDALPLIMKQSSHTEDTATADAYYLRDESAIYKPTMPGSSQ